MEVTEQPAVANIEAAFSALVATTEAAMAELEPAEASVLLQRALRIQDQWDGWVDRVARLTHEHLSWSEIGAIAGVTKQAAHHRWGRRAPDVGPDSESYAPRAEKCRCLPTLRLHDR